MRKSFNFSHLLHQIAHKNEYIFALRAHVIEMWLGSKYIDFTKIKKINFNANKIFSFELVLFWTQSTYVWIPQASILPAF